MTTIDEIEALLARATPGPWAQGSNWRCAGTHPPIDPERATCAYCDEGPPAEVRAATEEDIARGVDRRTMWHRHRNPDGDLKPWLDDDGAVLCEATGVHRVEGPAGEDVACNYDYEEGGIVRDEDAKLIVALRNAAPDLLAIARLATESLGCCGCEINKDLRAALARLGVKL